MLKVGAIHKIEGNMNKHENYACFFLSQHVLLMSPLQIGANQGLYNILLIIDSFERYKRHNILTFEQRFCSLDHHDDLIATCTKHNQGENVIRQRGDDFS